MQGPVFASLTFALALWHAFHITLSFHMCSRADAECLLAYSFSGLVIDITPFKVIFSSKFHSWADPLVRFVRVFD